MLGLFLKILLTTWSFFFQFPRTQTKSHLESHMESHLNLVLCSLEITQNQVKDQSKQLNDQSQQLNDQSQQIERLVAKNTEQSQQIAILTSTVQGLVQQVEPLTSQDRYQAAMVDQTATKQTKDQTNKIGATNANIKEGKFP